MQEIIIIEEWRNIRGYPTYQVSNFGRVRNTTSGRILKLSSNREGYLKSSLYVNGKVSTHNIHRLVALEFIPNPNNKPSVDHINCKAKHNNTIENLRWATQKEQCRNTSKPLNTSSQYKGVCWNKFHNRWNAYIKIDVKRLHLGYFVSEEEAALTYNKRAIVHFGEFANPNVIHDTQKKE